MSPRPPDPPQYFTGLVLGQQADFSALVVVERHTIPDPEQEGKTTYRFDVRHLHRWPLKTPYPAIVGDVKALFAEAPLKGSTLVLDETGVGRAVTDMVRAPQYLRMAAPILDYLRLGRDGEDRGEEAPRWGGTSAAL